MKHVVMTGFMAVGKTAVGKRLAKKLAREFVDTDELIEARAGMAVADIFGEHGEARFRELESQVIAELRPGRESVIATGGGAFADPVNRAALGALGVVVCLVTSLETVRRRILAGPAGARPLASDPGALEALFNKRMVAYKQADVMVETDGLSVDQSARRVLAAVGPRQRGGGA